jgi:hypothetical protein
MFSNDELTGLYNFLRSTGEGNLRKMLIDPKMTDKHFNVLMKIVRQCDESQFIEHFSNETFPKVKLSAPEMALKETFWAPCRSSFMKVGLLSQQKVAA